MGPPPNFVAPTLITTRTRSGRAPCCKRPRPTVSMRGQTFTFAIPKKYVPEIYHTKKGRMLAEQGITDVPEKPVESVEHEPLEPQTEEEAANALKKAVGGRVDVVVTGLGSDGRFAAALAATPSRFNALVLAPTRLQALACVAEVGEYVGKARTIPVVGRGPHALQDPARTAMGQSNNARGAVVVATPRALYNVFFRTNNGPKWLNLVERLVLYDPQYMADIGCTKHLLHALKFLPPATRRQTVILAPAYPVDDEKLRTALLDQLRHNTRRIVWPKIVRPTVPQRLVVTSSDCALSVLIAALNDARQLPECKAIVFMPTGRLAQVYAAIFRALDYNVEELHSRRSPASQMRALVRFAEASSLILFTSEMSAHRARDMRVTHVFCFGPPQGAARHAARIEVATPGLGTALLILEEHDLPQAKHVLGDELNPMQEATCYAKCTPQLAVDAHPRLVDIPWQLFAHGFMSWLRLHCGRLKSLGWTREELVQRANLWAKYTTGQGPWAVTKHFADRTRLWRVLGLKIDESDEYRKALGKAYITGEHNVDHSLDMLHPAIGSKGRNVRPRNLKPKPLKIADWKDIASKLKKEEQDALDNINRKSPEGRKYLALVAQKAIQRSLTPKPGEVKAQRKQKKADAAAAAAGKPVKRRNRVRLRERPGSPRFPKDENPFGI